MINSIAKTDPPKISSAVWNSNGATVNFNANQQLWKLSNQKLGIKLGFDNHGSFGLLQATNRSSHCVWTKAPQSVPVELNCKIDPVRISPGKNINDYNRNKQYYHNKNSNGIDNSTYLLKNKTDSATPNAFIYDKFTVSQEPNGSLVLTIRFYTHQLELQMDYAIYPNCAIIERWAELSQIQNLKSEIQNKLVTQFDSLNLNLTTSADKLTVYSITGLSQHLPYDSYIPHPSFIFQENLLDNQYKNIVDIYSGARSSERNLTWIAVQPERSNDGIFAGIEWSGESRFVIKKANDGFSVSVGITNFQYELGKDDRLVSPKSFFGVYSGSADKASQETHQFCRTYLAPKAPKDFPWVMYNTWFSYGIDQDEERMKKEIDNAAELGIEGFYLDAGWYQLSPSPAKTGNFDFSPGVGLWKENKEKYPSGIRALSDYCHQKGLKFGIWVEPERVDARTFTQETDSVTDIMLAKRDGQPISGDENKTMLLCLGNPEAREWLKRQLSYLIEAYQIDWLKWDNNSWGICNRDDHSHQAGNGNYAQILGLYKVLDYLHEKYPNLIIENCASGGNRLDFGIMKRTQVFWVHDDSYTSYVCRYHHFGTAFAFPPEYLNSWVIQDGDFTRALGQNRTIAKPTLDYIFRSRFLGACGISLRTLDWSPELKQQVKQEIAEYKRFRKYLNGEFEHLTPQTVIYNKTWEPPKSWEAFQYQLNNESVIFYFREDTDTVTQMVFPQGIKSKLNYEITIVDTQEKTRYTGSQLIKKGLALKLPDRFMSGIVLIKSI